MVEEEDIVITGAFLASNEFSHFQGQCFGPNGGDLFL